MWVCVCACVCVCVCVRVCVRACVQARAYKREVHILRVSNLVPVLRPVNQYHILRTGAMQLHNHNNNKIKKLNTTFFSALARPLFQAEAPLKMSKWGALLSENCEH